MADKPRQPTPAPQHAGDANSPKININDTVGALLLGLVALVLAFALWRAQARCRELENLLVRHTWPPNDELVKVSVFIAAGLDGDLPT